MAEESYPQLISLAVHELRTPASVVGGYLRMLQGDTQTPLSARHRKMVDEAEKSCARMVALIAELGEVGKLDAGLLAMQRAPIDLFALTAEVAESVDEASERGVRLAVQGRPGGAIVDGDRDRLKAAFQTIFRAILREKPGPCTVAVDRRIEQMSNQSSAVIVVSDDARALAHEASRKPFDEKRGGLGLALPIARRVIEAHQGRLWSPIVSGDSADGAARASSAAVIAIPIRTLVI